jgi:FtsZ-interacting cell division protein YlmF
MHVDWLKNKLTTNLEEEDVLELPRGNESNKVEEKATNVDVDMKKKTNERIFREMKKLESLLNPQTTKIVDEFDRGRVIVFEQVNMALLTTSLTKEPSSFEEAINC